MRSAYWSSTLKGAPVATCIPGFHRNDKWLLITSQRSGLDDELPLLRVIFLPQPCGELHAIRLEDKAGFRLTLSAATERSICGLESRLTSWRPRVP